MPVTLPFFDYAVPEEMKAKIKVGQLVKIPFLKSEIFGVVAELNSAGSEHKLKEIKEIVFTAPILSRAQINFLIDIAEFYHTSLGFILKSCLPPLQKRKLKKMQESGVMPVPAKQTAKSEFAKPTFFAFGSDKEKIKFILKKLIGPEQILYLVPELPNLEKIQKQLPENILQHAEIITGELSNKELFDKWMRIWSGEKNIIIGTRRALFLPWFNLKTIILDDEANLNYKSWDMAPRLHTRDAAIFLAKHHGAELNLLGHTPSVETSYFCQHKIYKNADSENTGALAIAPFESKPTIIDLRAERKAGNYNFISTRLVEEFKNIKSGDIFFYLNRRGSSSYVGCRDCGNVYKCPNCHITLNYHQDQNLLKCHYCGHSEPMRSSCPNCHGVNVTMFGVGTQQAETAIRRMLGASNGRKVVRIDSDVNDLENLNTPEDKIIVGTQLAWSYLDWSKIKLFAFLDADTSLFIPEYKVVENLFQLLRDAQYNLQDGAKLIIQTNHPDHLVFNSLFKPENFYAEQLKERQLLGYPPFKFLLKLFYGNHKQELAEREGQRMANLLTALTKSQKDIKIAGPLQTSPYYYGGQYWQVILAKIGYQSYKQNTKLLLSKLPPNWKVDPNPNSILYAN